MSAEHSRSRRAAPLIAALLLASTLFAAPHVSADPAPPAAVQTSSVGGTTLSGVVPDGVCAVQARAVGGGGGADFATGPINPDPSVHHGGYGADITGSFAVVAGQTYTGTVGGGGDGTATGPNAGGANGGGAGGSASFHIGSGGGGYTDFSVGGADLIVAGGGGGSGGGHHGGDGGDGPGGLNGGGMNGGDAGVPTGTGVANIGIGADGLRGRDADGFGGNYDFTTPGTGGTAAGPGAAGVTPFGAAAGGSPGSGRNGGAGGPDPGLDAGGGGGGGYFGGGGGAASVADGGSGTRGDNSENVSVGGSGGGGGSSFISDLSPDGLATPGVLDAATQAAAGGPGAAGLATTNGTDGLLNIDWQRCEYDLTIDKTASPTAALVGQTVTYTIVVTNNGPDSMTRGDTVTIRDNVASLFANAPTNIAATHTTVGAPAGLDQNPVTCVTVSTTPLEIDCSQPFSASAAGESPSGGERGLDVGGQVTVTYDILIDAADVTGGLVTNVAEVIDTEGPATDDAEITPAREESHLDVTKTADTPVNNGDGTWDLTYEVTVSNPSSVPGCTNDGSDGCFLIDNTNVQVSDPLQNVWGADGLVTAAAAVTSGPCTATAAYTGAAPGDLLSGINTLTPGDTCVVTVTATVDTDDDLADPAALGTTTNTVSAVSSEVTTPETATADVALTESPALDVVKTLTDGPTNQGDGTYVLEYTVDVTNTGDVVLEDVQVTDGLSDPAIFGSALSNASAAIASGPCDLNNTFTGFAPDHLILDGDDSLAVGESCSIVLTVTVTVDDDDPSAASIDTDYTNTANGSGTSPSGTTATGSDTATSQFTEDPAIEIVKTITSGPTNNADGTYDLTYELTVTNAGNVELDDVQVTDDLSAVYGAGLVSVNPTVMAGPCDENPGYTGTAAGDINVLDGDDVLSIPSGSCTIEVSVVVDAAAGAPVNSDVTNIAGASGDSPSGENVTSQDNSTTQLPENPAIDVAKSVSESPTNNGDGTFSLTYSIDVTNTGDVDLDAVQITDGLETVFGGALVSAAQSVAAGSCTENAAYTGLAPNANLLSGADTLGVGDSCQIDILVIVTVDASDPAAADLDVDYTNTADGQGTAPSGATPTDSDNATSQFAENPALDIDKNITSGPANNGDGTFTLTYTLDLANTGDVELRGVQVTDNLDTVYGAGAYTVDTQSASAPCELGGTYDGSATNATILDGNDVLAVGDTCVIEITVTVDTASATVDLDTDYTNNAIASGTSPGGEATGDNDPSTTQFSENPEIDLVKEVVGAPTNNGDGTHSVDYLLTVQNAGDVRLDNVQVTDGLEAVFGAQFVSATTSTGLPCTSNLGYTGTAAGDINLLAAGTNLEAGEVCGINVTVLISGENLGPHSNLANADGVSPAGDGVSDSDPADVTLVENPAIEVTKTVATEPVSNNDGSFTMAWDVVVENNGDVPLANVQVVDDLAATYVDAVSWTVDETSLAALDACTLSTDPFTGAAPAVNLLTGADPLVVGQTCTITISVTFTPGADLGIYTNDVTADGTSPAGTTVDDTSSAGVTVAENPAIDLTKSVVAGPTNDGNGIFEVTYELASTNVGDVPLDNVQITDDLDATFADAAIWNVVSVVSADCTANAAGFDGLPLGDPNLLDGTDSLAVGDACTVQLTVSFDPGGVLGTYTNSATADGTSPGGQSVDDSASTDEVVEENPAIFVNKFVVDPPGIVNNTDGSYTVTFGSIVQNTGDVPLNDVQVTDDLTVTFAAAAGFDVDPATVVVTSGPCTPNPSFDGNLDTGLLTGSDSLIVGQSCRIEFPVTVTNGDTLGFTNDVVADGTSPAGEDVDANGDVDILLPENPEISIAKDLIDPPAVVSNQDGTYTLSYRLVAENTGDVPLNNVQVVDDMSVTYADAISFAVTNVTIDPLDPCTENAGYNGDTDITLLTGTDSWAVGDTCTIDIEVVVEPGADLGAYDNNATASGTSPGGTGVDDVSQDGTDADPEGDGPGNNSDPTQTFFTEGPQISLSKAVIDGPTNNGDGTYSVSYELVVTNSGDVILYGVQVEDDLSATYADADAFVVDDVRIDAGLCTANDDFDGTAGPGGDIETLSGGDALAVAEACTIEIDVTFTPGASVPGPYNNTATADGTSPAGTNVTDDSQDGTDADPEGDGPGENSDPTPVLVSENPEIGLTKDIVAGPTSNDDGSFSLTYELVTTNTGDIVLNDVQVTDDLSVTYAAAAAWQVDAHRVANGPCDPALTYSGAAPTADLLDGNDVLAIGESCTLQIDVTVTPGGFLGDYDNTATTEGESPAGTGVNDVSQDGADADPDNDGPGNDSDPTTVSFTESPAIELVKAVVDGPTNDGFGTFTVTYALVSTNVGDVPLNNVQITDDLDTTFDGTASYTVTSVTSADCAANFPGFDGSPAGDPNLLSGTDTLGVGEVCTVELVVEFVPGAVLGTYTNAADTEGTSPGGEAVGDSASTDEAVTENPAIALDKDVVSGPTNDGSGNFSITYELVSTNTGDVPLNAVQIADDLEVTFDGVDSYTVTRVTSADCAANFPGFDGDADQNLLAGTDTLAVGESCSVELTVEFVPGAVLGTYTNAATTEGTSPAGESVNDDASTDEAVTENPAIEVTKNLVAPPGAVNNGDGAYSVTWSSTVTNTGDVPLNDVQINDDLGAAFGAATAWDVDPGAVAVTAGACASNGDFDGSTDTGLLAGTDTLAVGDSCTVEFAMSITPGVLDYTNEVTADATSPAGESVTDRSEDDVALPENPEITIVKDLLDPPAEVNNSDGTYTLTWRLVATNSGDVPLANVQIADDMSATFADAIAFSVADTDNVNAGDPCTLDTAYDGVGSDNLLDGTDTWAVGQGCTIDIEVVVTPGADLGAYTNTATAQGTSPGGASVNDLDDADAGFSENPEISLTKDVVDGPTSNSDGTYAVTYQLVVTNTGDVLLSDVQVDDDMSVTYAAASSWQVDAHRVVAGPCSAAATYNGSPLIGALAGDDDLAVGASCTIEIDVTFEPGASLPGPYDNSATADGTSPAGADVSDISQDGADADPEGDGPGDNSDPTQVLVSENPEIGLTKDVVDGPNSNGDGSFSLTYQLVATNTGDIVLDDVNVVDNLAATFATVEAWSVDAHRVVDGPCDAAAEYSGDLPAVELLDGNDTLVVGASCTIEIDVTVTPGADLGVHNNTAASQGTSPAGTEVTDSSHDGHDADPAGDGPADDSDPTPVTFVESPAIALTKDIVDGPVNDGSGFYELTYELVVTNVGDVRLEGVQIEDDLGLTYADAITFIAMDAPVTSGGCTPNLAPYTGTVLGSIDLLSGIDTLGVGESCTVQISVRVLPGADLGPYDNSATADGTSPAGADVDDISQDGTDADPDGDGAGNDSDPTPAWFAEAPQISLTKDIVDGPTSNGDGTYDLTYELVVANSGDVDLSNVQVEDDLGQTYGAAEAFDVLGWSVESGVCAPATTYDGLVDLGLLSGDDSLMVSDTCTLQINVQVTPGAELGPYDNSATAAGISPSGADVIDVSQDGTDADPDGDNDPSNDVDPTPATFSEQPEIGLAKAITDGPTRVAGRGYDVTYTLIVENTGQVQLDEVQIVDSLQTTFATAESWQFQGHVVRDGACSLNTGFDGNADTKLLSGNGVLAIGETCTIELNVLVTPRSGATSAFANSADAAGISPAGTEVTDISQDGLSNDPNNRGVSENSAPTVFEVDVPEPKGGLVWTGPDEIPPGFGSPSTGGTPERPGGPQAFTTNDNGAPLAYTGSNARLLALIGLAMVVAGAAFVAVGTKRRNDDDDEDGKLGLEWKKLDT